MPRNASPRVILAALGIALALGAAAPLAAQTLAERAALIEAHIAAGRTAEAHAEARALHRAATLAAGLHLTPPVLVMERARGLGVYVPRATAVYTGGEPVLQYFEASGFGLERGADGVNQLRLQIAFHLIDAAGTDLTGPVEMGLIALDTRAEPTETYVDLTYNITGITGTFVLRTEVTDMATGRTAQMEQAVEFR
jgi:hypothetical protein